MNFLPKIMSAIKINENGGPEVLTINTVPIPKINNHEVLIKNYAIGVNRADCLQRQGNYPVPKDSNQMLGLEVAGEIVQVGGKVTNLKYGDKVCALTPGGGYAQYSVSPYQHCFKISKNLNFSQSACIPEAAFTVYDNLFQRANIKNSDTILIHGGSSGIGSFAVQLLKAIGANVITTSGNAEKCEFCIKIGSDLALNYLKEDWQNKIKKFTDNKGVNVVLDIVAGDYINKNISIMAPKGRHITIALQRGRFCEIDFGLVMRKQLILSGSTLRPQSLEEKNKTAENIRKVIWPFIEDNKIKPYIHSTFPLSQANQAHALMESGKHYGKIILLP